MQDVLQYVIALGVMTLIVKIVYDWLKNRNGNIRYVTREECKTFEKAVESKLEMIMMKIEKIEDRLDRLYEKLANMG